MEPRSFTPRSAEVRRETKETRVHVRLRLDENPAYHNDTGVGFLDHMLDLFAKHGGFGLEVTCDGDLHVDEHHTVEDVAISLGRAFSDALGEKEYIQRYGHAYVPMDEALARAVVDLSGRFYLRFDATFQVAKVGDLSTELVQHFWYAFGEHCRCNLHVGVLSGDNTHHKIEAIFKAVARAMRLAVARSETNAPVPSTKGML